MRLSARLLVVAMASVLLMASAASAITVYDVVRTDFDPSVKNVLDPLNGYGTGGYYLTYKPIDPVTGLFDKTGGPHATGGPFTNNPPWLDFRASVPSGGAAHPVYPNQVLYTLASTDTKAHSFDFSILFYDYNLDASIADATVAAEVIITGKNETKVVSKDGNKVEVTAGDIRSGTVLTWKIDVPVDPSTGTGEDISIVISSYTYAAGFFLDNVAPEPATLSLVAAGLAGLWLKRRR
jgi:hypothetical protein